MQKNLVEKTQMTRYFIHRRKNFDSLKCDKKALGTPSKYNDCIDLNWEEPISCPTHKIVRGKDAGILRRRQSINSVAAWENESGLTDSLW